MRVPSLGGEDPLGQEMATHSSIPVWKILWAEEPGGLQSVELQSQTQLSTAQLREASSYQTAVSRDVR